MPNNLNSQRALSALLDTDSPVYRLYEVADRALRNRAESAARWHFEIERSMRAVETAKRAKVMRDEQTLCFLARPFESGRYITLRGQTDAERHIRRLEA